jgi:hypothetical protein
MNEIRNTKSKKSVTPIQQPMDGLTIDQHKNRNSKHIFWKGHLPKFNRGTQEWEYSGDNIWGGSANIRRDDGKLIYTRTSPDKIVLEHRIISKSNGVDGEPVIKYASVHKIPNSNHEVQYSQHFMARVHDYNDNGTQITKDSNPRRIPPASDMHEVLKSLHKNIVKQGIIPSKGNAGWVAHSLKHNIYIPIVGHSHNGVHTLHVNTIVPNISEHETKSLFLIEGILDFPRFDI